MMGTELISIIPEIYSKEIGKKEWNRDSEFSNTRTEQFIMDSTLMMSKMDLEKWNTIIPMNSKENSKMVRSKVKGSCNFLMEIYMKEILKMQNLTEKESSNQKMVWYSRVIGKMVYNLVKEKLLTRMVILFKVCFRTIFKTDSVSSNQSTAPNMKECSLITRNVEKALS